MNGRDLLDDIKKYAHAASHGGVSCDLDRCPCCHGRPVCFKCHGVRPRLFLVFAEAVIRRVQSYLTRWKCPLCRRTFTLYPAFALPFKRYVLPFLLARCTAYVDDAARTYRDGVNEAGQPISHADLDAGAQLWPSTLWRWVTTLSRLPVTVRAALNLIKQKEPSTDIFRDVGPAPDSSGQVPQRSAQTHSRTLPRLGNGGSGVRPVVLGVSFSRLGDALRLWVT